MPPRSPKSDTAAFTNALKQVYCIHKNIVADLKAKLDIVNDAYTKQKEQLSGGSAEKCTSCVHLEEMNRDLQQHFNSLLREKDATIKSLEAKVKSSKTIGKYVDAPKELSKSPSKLPPTDRNDTGPPATDLEILSKDHGIRRQIIDEQSPQNLREQKLDPVEDDDHGEATLDDGGTNVARNHSKLRLTRHGKKRSRYVEEVPDTKRRKILTAATTNDGKAFKGLDDHNQTENTASVKTHHDSVLVPETEITVRDKRLGNVADAEMNKDRDGDSDYENSDESQQMLIVPETLAMDYSTNSDSDDDDDEDTVKENKDILVSEEESKSNRKLLSIDRDDNQSNECKLSEDDDNNKRTEDSPCDDTLKAQGEADTCLEVHLEKMPNVDSLEDEDVTMNSTSQIKDKLPRDIKKHSHLVHSENSIKSLRQNQQQHSQHLSSFQEDENGTNEENSSRKNQTYKKLSLSIPEIVVCDDGVNKDDDDLPDINFLSSPRKLLSANTNQSLHHDGNKTPVTPGSVSPRIFDSPKVKHHTGTPKKWRKGDFRNNSNKDESDETCNEREISHHRARDLRQKKNDENSPSSKSLRQTTLSQVLGARGDSTNRHRPTMYEKTSKSDADIEEEEKRQMEEAIRRSLKDIQNSPQRPKKVHATVVEPEFRVPQSPPLWRSPKSKYAARDSPRKANSSNNSPLRSSRGQQNVNYNNSPQRQFLDQREDSQAANSPSRCSPKLFEGREKSPQSPLSKNTMKERANTDSARKELFQHGSQKSQRESQNVSQAANKRNDSTGGSQEEQMILPQYSMPMCSLTPLELRVWNQPTVNKTQDSPKRSGKVKERQSSDSQGGERKKSGSSAATFDPNGSLNPDIRLSEYLDSQVMTERPKHSRNAAAYNPTLDTLDETIAPNLVAENVHLQPQLNKTSPSKRRSERAPREEPSEWWTSGQQKGKEEDDGSDDELVFSDGENENETIAPSPQQSLQAGSQPHFSIPSSSRSFKFVHKLPWQGAKPKNDVGASRRDQSKIKGQPLVNVKVVDMAGDTIDQTVDNMQTFYDDGEEQELTLQDEKADVKDVKPELPLQSLYDSFDRVPRVEESQIPHIDVVRKKSERNKLEGFSCKQCYEYYKNSGLSEEAMKQKMKECSRHRERYRAPDTPEHFWSLGFPDTAEVAERASRSRHSDESPVAAQKAAPRRRRRLEKKF